MTTHPHLPGEAPPHVYKTHDEEGRTSDPNEAIFPIVTQDADGQLALIGTGFYIAQYGIFVTAAHVVTAVLDHHGRQNKPLGLFQFLPNNAYMVRPINNTVCHPIADIAVGVAAQVHHIQTKKPLRNKVIPIGLHRPATNDHVATYAYPKTYVTPGQPTKIQFCPVFFEGKVVEYFPNGRDRHFMPGICYRTTMIIHGGASGGPVLDKEGAAIAVNSTGFENDTISFVTCISQIFELALPNVKTPGNKNPQPTTIKELCDHGYVCTNTQAGSYQGK